MNDKLSRVLEYLGDTYVSTRAVNDISKAKEIQEEITAGVDSNKFKIYFFTSYEVDLLRSETTELCKLLTSAGIEVIPVLELNSKALNADSGGHRVFILWVERFRKKNGLPELIRDLEEGSYSRMLAGNALIIALTVDQYRSLHGLENKDNSSGVEFPVTTKDRNVPNKIVRSGFILLSLSFLAVAIWYPLAFWPNGVLLDNGYLSFFIFAILISIGLTMAGIALLLIGTIHLDLKGKRLMQALLLLFSLVNFISFLMLTDLGLGGSNDFLQFQSSNRFQMIFVSFVGYTSFLAVYALVPIPYSNIKQKLVLLAATAMAYLSYYFWAVNEFPAIDISLFHGYAYTISMPFSPIFGAPAAIEFSLPNSDSLYFITSTISNSLFFIAYLWVSCLVHHKRELSIGNGAII